MKTFHPASWFIALVAVLLFAQVSAAGTAGKVGGEGNVIRLKALELKTEGLEKTLSGVQPMSATQEGYYILQFKDKVREEWKVRLKEKGIKFFGYVPENAFVVKASTAALQEATSDPDVQWTGEYRTGYRLDNAVYGILSKEPARKLTLAVKLFDGEDVGAAADAVQAMGGQIERKVDSQGLNGKKMHVSIEAAKAGEVAAIPGVEWVEQYRQPVLFNDVAVGPTLMNVSPVWSSYVPYTGKNQVVGIMDTGIDKGNLSTVHPAFLGKAGNGQAKIKTVFTYGRTGDWSDPNGHGTHTSGSLAGKPFSSYNVKGVAYDAQIVLQSVLTAGGGLNVPDLNTTSFPDAYANGARVHSDSWGANGTGEYDSECQDADTYTWDHKDFLPVFAAGNSGVDANYDGVIDAYSLGTPATAKNVLTVGASENLRPSIPVTYGDGWPSDFPVDPIYSDLIGDHNNGMAAFSSRGPTQDNRIKPDVVAPGTWILSTRSTIAPDNNYWALPSDIGLASGMNTYFALDGGTSMATPLTAGAAAVVRQYLSEGRGFTDPSSALIKAVLINGATDMTPGQYGYIPAQEITAWPDRSQGWGRVNLANAILPTAPYAASFWDNATGPATGETVTYPVVIDDPSVPFRITLAWSDYPGNPAVTDQLVNDLDLKVTLPDGTVYHGNNKNPNPPEDASGYDGVNNVEVVYVPTMSMAGTAEISVTGSNVAQGGHQPFAIAATGGFPMLNGIYTNYSLNGLAASVTATFYINNVPQSGKKITFYDQAPGGAFASKGSVTTNAAGVATKIYASTLGTHNAYAIFTASGVLPTTQSDTFGYTIGKVTSSMPLISTVTDQTPDITWDAYPGATGYHVQASTSSKFSPTTLVLDADETDITTTATMPALTAGLAYYWRVLASVPDGKTMYSDVRKVTYKVPTAMTLTLDSLVGFTATLRATLTDVTTGLPMPGRSVTFYENTAGGSFASKGSVTTGAVTSANPGVAIKIWTTTPGLHNAKAFYKGDKIYMPVTTDPALVSYTP